MAVIVVCEILGKCATLAFTVVVARELGVNAFGSFSYALAFGLLLGVLVSWGFDASVVRRGSEDRRQLDAALTEALVLRTIHAVPVVLAGGLIGVLIRPDRSSAITLVLILLATILDGYGDTGRSAATACERPGVSAAALVVQRLAACILAIAILAAGGGLVAVSAAYLCSSVIGQLTLVLVLRRLGIRLRPSEVRADQLRWLWRSTFLLGLDSVLAMAVFRIDALMLGEMAGDRELASYSVAYRLMETVLFVVWAVTRSLLPAMVRAGRGRALLQVGENAFSIVAALFVPYGVLLWLEGEDLIRLVFGSDYGADSSEALTLLCFAPLAFGLGQITGYLLFVRQWNGRLLLTSVVILGVNVGLNFILIPEYGAVGAAAATTLSLAVEAIIYILLLWRDNGLYRVDRALLLPVGAVLPMAGSLYLVESHVALDAAVAGVVYLAAYLLLARWRDPAQLKLLTSLVRRG